MGGENVPRKLFPCSICRKLLTTSVKLKTHIEVIHMGKRDFNCRFCSKQFTSKSNLLIHEGTQHTGVLPYSCDHCDKSFGRKTQLSVHREQVHGITGTDSDAPPSSEHKSSSTVTHTNTSNIPSNNQVIMSDMMATAADVQEQNRFGQGNVMSNQLTASQAISGQVIPEQLTSHMITDHLDSHQMHDHQLMEDNDDVISDHQLDTHVIEEIDRHVITENALNDAHYYVVNDVNGVQVGDVIIPMEFVEVIDQN